MNEVDAAILLIISLSCIFGFWRGLIKEFVSLITWITASVMARVFSADLAAALENTIENSNVRYLTAFALIVILIMIWGALLKRYMSKRFSMVRFKNSDHFLGGVFGITRGGVVVVVILTISMAFVAGTEQWQRSILIPYAMTTIDWSQGYIGDINIMDLNGIDLNAIDLNGIDLNAIDLNR